jgi:acetylornithine deacetylase
MLVKEILTKLVSFPVLGGQSNLPIIEWIASYLDDYGVTYQFVPNEEGNKKSLHCRIGPAVDGGMILSGHTDVVPVAGQDWSTNPFELTERKGLLYGRGSCDMKGFIACCLAALPEMVKADLQKPIYFAFSYDEEIGCLAGPALVDAINDFYTEKPKFAIIGEPSMLQPVVGQKSIAIYRTKVKGSAGHSSRIKQEVSSIHEVARLVLWLENKMDELIAAGQTDDRFHPNHSSLHCGLIQGGIAPNVIADHAHFSWDCRTIPKDDAEQIYQDFLDYCAEREAVLQQISPDARIETEIVHPIVPSLDTPEHLEIVGLIKKLSGSDHLQTVAYAAEAGQFANGGFQTVICGPGDIAQAHRKDEFISIEQLEMGVNLIRNIIQHAAAPVTA